MTSQLDTQVSARSSINELINEVIFRKTYIPRRFGMKRNQLDSSSSPSTKRIKPDESIDSEHLRHLFFSTSQSLFVGPLFDISTNIDPVATEDNRRSVLQELRQDCQQRIYDLTGEFDSADQTNALVKLEEKESTEDHPPNVYHHDYILQEMQWMSSDFEQERKWKTTRSKKLVRSVVNYHKKQATKAVKEARALEIKRKRHAAKLAKDIKKFWGKIDRIIAYRYQLEEQMKKKQVMDEHLRFLIGQTEKYATAMATCFLSSSGPLSNNTASTNDDDPSSPITILYDNEEEEEKMDLDENDEQTIIQQSYDEIDTLSHHSDDDDDDVEFLLTGSELNRVDDESTIQKAEAEQTDKEISDELQALQDEGSMPIEALKEYYAKLEQENDTDSNISIYHESEEDEGGGDDFIPSSPGNDDEYSIALQEERDRENENGTEEMALLEEEANLSIEELKMKYMIPSSPSSNMELNGSDKISVSTDGHQNYLKMLYEKISVEFSNEMDSDFCDSSSNENELDDETSIIEEESIMMNQNHEESDEDPMDEIERLKMESELPVESIIAEYYSWNDIDSDDDDTKSIREDSALQSKEKKNQFYKPFLLSNRLKLREYQEVGVNWLISMYHRRMNGILADEMGLGKTIQTISLLAHLACVEGIWGPHLIVVPTSCLVNWEMEFKRWCPGFKVLTYYGTSKQRKELRQGWAKQNAFQICITSYQLVVQDAFCFRRKKWYFLILDEAHNIKNWKSQRWQTLLHFNSQRRLLLTGTPLQNNLMELWALMHFLMPHVFRSRKEFSYWFSTPLNLMVEGEEEVNNSLVSRLHDVIRPFVLRRLKKDVEKQMPGKYEHIIVCQLSKRQRHLYEDFMSRSSTRNAMSKKGSFLGMMNVLMQLRKVCNHPDLFEPRPIISSFDFPSLEMYIPSCTLIQENLAFGYNLWGEGSTKQLFSSLSPFFMKRVQELQVSPREIIATTEQKIPLWIRFFDPVQVNCLLKGEDTDNRDQSSSVATTTIQMIQNYVTILHSRQRSQIHHLQDHLAQLNSAKCHQHPLCYGKDLIEDITMTHLNPALVAKSSSCVFKDFVLSAEERMIQMLPMLQQTACIVPKVRVLKVQVQSLHRKLSVQSHQDHLYREIKQKVYNVYCNAFYETFRRRQLFFPDKRLIQFDCGKLQQLDQLLRRLKSKNHRCLIFTQMSSMLDILEFFLNLHGHPYYRLDGSTKIEKRQYLMDRFNADDKIFCFILSTRSGGLGINLTGADTVIFYDSDWNPAMDAQAQDRAHRIGQTRDVHIYRLISEHTIEENILKKAQQKRHLDFLVMSEGQFTTDFFTKSTLRDIVGTQQDAGERQEYEEDSLSKTEIEQAMNRVEDAEDVEAMKGAKQELLNEKNEFDDIVYDFKQAQHKKSFIEGEEQDEEQDEDDRGEIEVEAVEDEGDNEDEFFSSSSGEEDEDDDNQERNTNKGEKMQPKNRHIKSKSKSKANISPQSQALALQKKLEKEHEKELELEQEQKLQEWKKSVSLNRFEEGLKPIERYAIHFREAMYATLAPLSITTTSSVEQIELDIEEIEARQIVEEDIQLHGGELIYAGKLNTSIENGNIDNEALDALYHAERRNFHRERKRRLLTGENWQMRICARTKSPYYFNMETGESCWEKPRLIAKYDEMKLAKQHGFSGLPMDSVLLIVAQYLIPYSERHQIMALVCSAWSTAAMHSSFWHRILAVNDSEAEGEKVHAQTDIHETAEIEIQPPIAANSHACNLSLNLLLQSGQLYPGETIQLSTGIHRIEGNVEILIPLRWIGSSTKDTVILLDSTHSIRWLARGGCVEGITIKRTRPSRDAMIPLSTIPPPHSFSAYPEIEIGMFQIQNEGQVTIRKCCFDGNYQPGACVYISGKSSRLVLRQSVLHRAGDSGMLVYGGDVILYENVFRKSRGSGITMIYGHGILQANEFRQNAIYGVNRFATYSLLLHETNEYIENGKGAINIDASYGQEEVHARMDGHMAYLAG